MNNYFCTNDRCAPCQQPTPPQQPAPVQRPCCPCGEDLRKALELICCPQLRSLVDFDTFAFITDFYVLGTALTAPDATTAPGDNLDDPAATYVCGGDSCETVTVSGTLYPPVVGGAALAPTVTQAALCQLTAVSFEAAEVDESAEANFQTISQTLGQLLRPHRPVECCSVADALTTAAAVRASTVAAGPLIVQNSTILGQIGSVLVMANSTDSRFYFICANSIDFMG